MSEIQAQVISLDELAKRDPDDLMEMYRSARTPALANHGHGVNRLLGERVTWFRFHCFFGIARPV